METTEESLNTNTGGNLRSTPKVHVKKILCPWRHLLESACETEMYVREKVILHACQRGEMPRKKYP